MGRTGPRARPGQPELCRGGSDLPARPQPAARSRGPRAPGLPGTPLLPRSRPRARPRPLRTGAGGAGPGRLPPAAASPRGTGGQRGARAEPRQRPAPSRRASRRLPLNAGLREKTPNERVKRNDHGPKGINAGGGLKEGRRKAKPTGSPTHAQRHAGSGRSRARRAPQHPRAAEPRPSLQAPPLFDETTPLSPPPRPSSRPYHSGAAGGGR